MRATLRDLFDSGTREARLVTALAVALIVARSAIFTFSESIAFDSDQAIVGLMAKHISELRAFPLFFYGQHYMLGVQAWLAAPLFWIARPTVAMLKLPLLVLNVVTGVLLVRMLGRQAPLRPLLAFVAALPFIVPTPMMASGLVHASGAAVEPFLYVLILWRLRGRPVAFGAVLAFGALQREFTLYALPALALVSALDGSMVRRGAVRACAQGLAGFAVVWLALDVARRSLEGASIALQAVQMTNFVCLDRARVIDKLHQTLVAYLPIAAGATVMPIEPPMRNAAIVGWPLVGWLVAVALAVMAVRLLWTWRSAAGAADLRLAAYLGLIGLITIAVYPTSCGAQAGSPPILRYLHLALFLPVALFAAFAARERRPVLVAAMAAVFLLWAGSSLADHGRVVYEAVVHPEVDPHRELADFLVNHQIRYARATYWDSYIVDFLSREQVIVASSYPTRVAEYERLVAAYPRATMTIERLPCAGQYVVSAWCIRAPER